MNNPVSILGADGQPMAPRRPSMLAGGSNVPYDAADRFGEHLRNWNPYLPSPDGQINMSRDTIVSRVRDLVRNDGWAAGSVTRAVDNAVGATFRPIFKPDWQALQRHTGIKAFDHKWADEFGMALDASYRTWATDAGRYCDVERGRTMQEMMHLSFRHVLIDNDALGIFHWLPDRVGEGRARYATAFQLVDPDRLSNPQLRFDTETLRGGVEIDEYGAAIAYHMRKAHQNDWFNAAKSVTWERIDRETPWGRPIVVHYFEADRAGQHRGGAGILAPVLTRMKMLAKYDGAELDAAVINAIFAAFIESPYDPELVESAVSDSDSFGPYQNERVKFHEEKRLHMGGARIPILFPGEKIGMVSATRPNANFRDFEGAVLRNVAAGAGLSEPQVSNNWADMNYSAARGALLEAWKTLSRRRNFFAVGWGQQIVCGFAEEAMEYDDLPLPRGAPGFADFRTAYSRAKWMGPGRGVIDPVKERQGAILGMDAGLSTLEDEAAEMGGLDWREVVAQRAIEVDRFRELGLPLPDWAGGIEAQRAITEPGAQ